MQGEARLEHLKPGSRRQPNSNPAHTGLRTGNRTHRRAAGLTMLCKVSLDPVKDQPFQFLHVVYLDHDTGALYIERPADSERYTWIFTEASPLSPPDRGVPTSDR
jgi:hypothetical protein